MDSEMNYTVYRHVFPNGKQYIGITNRSVKKRWNSGNGYRDQIRMYRAIKKYGWNNMEHKIIIRGLTKEQAFRWEIRLIKHYNTTNNKFGYNIDKGGNSGHNHTAETRAKISKNNARKRKIICLNDGKIYNTITEAHKATGVARCMISNICAGRKHMIYGYGFKYLDDYNKLSSEEQKKIRKDFMEYRERSLNKSTACVCLEHRKIFSNFREASKAYKCNVSSIRLCCEHQMYKAGNFHWIYLKEYQGLSDKDIEQIIYRKTIICLETKKLYEKCTHAAKCHNISSSSVWLQCHGGKFIKDKPDLHFMYYLDYLEKSRI